MTGKPKIRYGSLDDFGEVVRWQWERPSKNYKFVTQRVAPIDWNNVPLALF